MLGTSADVVQKQDKRVDPSSQQPLCRMRPVKLPEMIKNCDAML